MRKLPHVSTLLLRALLGLPPEAMLCKCTCLAGAHEQFFVLQCIVLRRYVQSLTAQF